MVQHRLCIMLASFLNMFSCFIVNEFLTKVWRLCPQTLRATLCEMPAQSLPAVTAFVPRKPTCYWSEKYLLANQKRVH